MNPQAVLQERYPLDDFSIYFPHLEACRTVKGLNTHEHHICPRAQFPEYAEGFPENLITLTIEDHAHAHKLLEAACGIKAPPTAWLEAQRDGAAKGGKIGGALGGRNAGRKTKENGTGIFGRSSEKMTEDSRKGGRKSHENGTGVFGMTPEQRAAAGRIGGRIGGRKASATHKKNGTGFYSRELQVKGGRVVGRKNVESGQLASLRTPEHQAKAGRIANHIRWHASRGITNPKCSLCQKAEVLW